MPSRTTPKTRSYGRVTVIADLDPEFGAGFGQPIPTEPVVLVAEANAFAPVASLRDVMRRAGKDNACDARHARGHTGACAMCVKTGVSP